MELSNQALTLLVLLSLGLAVLALFILGSSAGRRGRARGSRDSAAVGLRQYEEDLGQLRAAIRELALQDHQLAGVLERAIQRVGVIRFDAFEDMGGRLSFSAAFLDAKGNGVVITSINGRQDTRVYSKPVMEGASDHNLSAEEHQAIRRALTSSVRDTRAAS
jgi:hypothetical protein